MNNLLPLLLLVGAMILLAPPLAKYLVKAMEGQKTFLSPVLRPVETLIYRASGIDPAQEMGWKRYTADWCLFNLVGFVFLMLLQMFQSKLPLNPQHLPNVSWHLAFNTAMSFVTNTNWQSYAGEVTMSYLVQLLGLTVQNFVSAAAGMAALMVLIRGFTRKTTSQVGNFWADLTRMTVNVLLPLAILWAVLLVSQGVVQTFHPSVTVRTLEGVEQHITVGPAASQIAIKQIGTNGGGFFNVNSAHPFENPTPLSNFIECLGIILLAAATPLMFGRMLGNKRQGRALFAAMLILLLIGLGVGLYSELQPNPNLTKLGVGGAVNMEGKEVRIGAGPSALWAVITTVTSNGSVNSMHDSLMPLTGLVAMFNIGIGEAIFGGVGVGLIGMLFYAIIAMFIGGLMIGRTPEIYGKKLEAREMSLAMVALIGPAVAILIFTALALVTKAGLSSMSASGPHGLSQVLYAYSSALGNNGSAFAGLNANTPFYNVTIGFAILCGRLLTILPALAIGGSLALKKSIPTTSATFPTTSVIFVAFLVGTVIIVGALTFFPVYAMGPILEHLMLPTGQLF